MRSGVDLDYYNEFRSLAHVFIMYEEHGPLRAQESFFRQRYLQRYDERYNQPEVASESLWRIKQLNGLVDEINQYKTRTEFPLERIVQIHNQAKELICNPLLRDS